MAAAGIGWLVNGRGRPKRKRKPKDGTFNGRRCATADALERSLAKVRG
jgi:hypothetical protein